MLLSLKLKKNIHPLLFLLPFIVLLSGCSSKSEKELGLLPSAKGDTYEVILVMDTVKWNGALGDQIKDIFMHSISKRKMVT